MKKPVRLADVQLDPAKMKPTEDAIKRALTIPVSSVPKPKKKPKP